jgi:uncharacterized protein YgiM (DUF1202 family)
MRRTLSLTLVVAVGLLAAGLATAPAAADSGKKFIYVKARAANVRAIPSVQGQILATLPFGSRLLAQEKIGDWYQVRLDDQRLGYIYEELVTSSQPARLWVDAATAPVYAEPSPYAPLLATLPGGTELKCLGKGDDWYKVALDGQRTGWVHEDLVDDDPPGVLFVRVVSASVHASPSAMSEVVGEVAAGAELTKILKIDDFYRVRLASGKEGFVYKRAVTDEPPTRLFVDVPQADIKTDPTIYGTVKTKVTSGTELLAFDKEDDFYLVRAPDGTLGWIYDENVIRMSK